MNKSKKKIGGFKNRCQAKTMIGHQCKNKIATGVKINIDDKEIENTYFCQHHLDRILYFKEIVNKLPDDYYLIPFLKNNQFNNYFEPQKWNDNFTLQYTHNCAAYAYNTIIKKIKDDCKKICINEKKYNNYPSNENNIKNLKKHCPHLQSQCRSFKPQPGVFRGIKTRKYTCPEMVYKTIADNPKTYITSFEDDCKDNYRKIAVVVNPGDGYHYYKQDRRKSKKNTKDVKNNEFITWSHKPGSTPVTKKDASGHITLNPLTSDRIYNNNPYTEFCNFMCIPTKDNNIEYVNNPDNNLEK